MKLLCMAVAVLLVSSACFADRGAGSGGVGGYGGMTPHERDARRPDRYGAMKPAAVREAEQKAEEREARVEQQKASDQALLAKP